MLMVTSLLLPTSAFTSTVVLYKRDMVLFLKALKNNPKSVEAQYLLAQCQRNLYRFEEALDSARKALELDPINPEGLYELCETYRRMGNQTKALEIAKKMDALPQAKKIFDTKKLVSII